MNIKGVVAVKEDEIPPRPVLSRNAAANFFINIIENNNNIKQTVNLSNSDL